MLLGRDDELRVLTAACDAAATGHGSALVLVGEPGIGKTALLDALVAGTSMRVLRARGAETESTLAFATLQALLWPLRQSVDRLAPEQAALLHGVLALGPGGGATVFSVGAATLALLSACSEDSPLAVAVDDAHVADVATQDVLAFLARRVERERIALLAAARNDEPCLLLDGSFRRLEIAGLAETDARALLKAAAPELSGPVAERLLEQCRGNPLGLLELPRALTEAQRRGEDPIASLEGGPALQQAFAARVHALGERTRDALLLLAAAGDGEAAARAMSEEERRALAEAERAGLVRRRAVAAFRHPLVQAAVYGTADAGARRAAHRRIAAVVDGSRRAWQLALAAEGPSEEVASALERAAEEARVLGGVVAQAQALERSAQLTLDDERRARRLLAAATAWREAGRVQHGQELLAEALRRAREPRTRWQVQLERGGNLERTTAYRDAYDLLLREARSAEPVDPRMAARLYAALALVVNQYPEGGSPLDPAERAVELAGRDGDEVEVEALFALVSARMNRLPPDERDEEVVARAAALLEQRSLRTRERPHWIAYALAERERDDDARRLSDVALAEARAAGDVWSECYGLFARAAIELTTGRVDAARTWALEAIPLAEQVDEPWRRQQAETVLGEVEAARGNVAHCERALGDAHPYRDLHLGRALLATGRFEEAAERLERADETLSRGSPRYWYRWIPLDLAEAYAGLGRRREAERVLLEMRPVIERTRLARPQARLARVAAWFVPEARIDTAFATALAHLERAPHHLEHARVELTWGERLRRSGRSADAVPHLERALARFEALGATGWSERARVEIAQATGKRPPASARRTDVLTPQELRVARHAAGGMRDREIAAALYLSRRTVESHLHSAYAKLGISNRTQLAAVLAADGVPAVTPTENP